MARYSLFLNDSTPKIAMIPQRTKFGVSKKVNKYKKSYDLMTVPKENELGTPARDSLYYFDEGEFLASDFVDMDTLGVDSVSAAPMLAVAEIEEGPEYKYRYHPQNPYNVEQEYYNKYYGELFVEERVTVAAMLAGKEFAQPAIDTTASERKGLRGLFKRNNSVEEQSELLSEDGASGATEVEQLIDSETETEEGGEEEPVNKTVEEPVETEQAVDTEEPEVPVDAEE